MFPDDFHLHTLEALDKACAQLQPEVAVGGILVALMERLARCARWRVGQLATQRSASLEQDRGEQTSGGSRDSEGAA